MTIVVSLLFFLAISCSFAAAITFFFNSPQSTKQKSRFYSFLFVPKLCSFVIFCVQFELIICEMVLEQCISLTNLCRSAKLKVFFFFLFCITGTPNTKLVSAANEKIQQKFLFLFSSILKNQHSEQRERR